jgi:hypothetical protein
MHCEWCATIATPRRSMAPFSIIDWMSQSLPRLKSTPLPIRWLANKPVKFTKVSRRFCTGSVRTAANPLNAQRNDDFHKHARVAPNSGAGPLRTLLSYQASPSIPLALIIGPSVAERRESFCQNEPNLGLCQFSHRGVEFIDQNGGGPGVRLRKPVRGKSGKSTGYDFA